MLDKAIIQKMMESWTTETAGFDRQRNTQRFIGRPLL